MLDNWEKTHDLLASLKAATPFEVELTPPLMALLLAEAPGFDRQPRQVVRNVSYIEPDGGREAVVVSLTHLRLRRSLPFAAAVQGYQKHRMKKLKKQNG